MMQLLDIVQKLTDEERRQVQDFAEGLLARRTGVPKEVRTGPPGNRILYEGWAGCLAHVHPEMSDAEFKQLIRDEWVRAADDSSGDRPTMPMHRPTE